jgi:hypothetical protein
MHSSRYRSYALETYSQENSRSRTKRLERIPGSQVFDAKRSNLLELDE